jgi:hypothetical protein
MASLTKFPYGVSSFGGAVLPGPGLCPNVVPTIGTGPGIFFVNGDYGSDGNPGRTPTAPLKNLDTAYNMCYGDANEIIYVLGGNSAVSFSSKIASAGAGLVWAKNNTHLLGLCSPGSSGLRSRITEGPSTNYFTPLLTVSANGCLFQNIEFFNSGAHATEAAVCVSVTGSYNTFQNCQISGGGNTTNATNAAMRSLLITGPSGENTFQHCYIGLTTIARNTTSAEIEIKGGSPRNWFEDCTIASYTSSATTLLVLVDADGIDRHLVFKNCLFINPGTASGGTIMSQALDINATPGGVVMCHNCLSGGASVSFTKLQTTASGPVFGDNAGSAAGAYGVAMTS